MRSNEHPAVDAPALATSSARSTTLDGGSPPPQSTTRDRGSPPLQPTTLDRGSTAEQRAVELLIRSGLRIVERNYRCKLGELDIIARDGTTLVFVEVRSRRDATYGSALEAVGWRKQRQVSRVAKHYLVWRRPRFIAARFDVVAITGDEIVHIRDAWRLPR